MSSGGIAPNVLTTAAGGGAGASGCNEGSVIGYIESTTGNVNAGNAMASQYSLGSAATAVVEEDNTPIGISVPKLLERPSHSHSNSLGHMAGS